MKATTKIANMIRLDYSWREIRRSHEKNLLDEIMGRDDYKDPTPDSPKISGEEIREAGELLLFLSESIAESHGGDVYVDLRELLEDIAYDWIHFFTDDEVIEDEDDTQTL